MELLEILAKIAVQRRLLVRILAVPERLHFRQRQRQCLRQSIALTEKRRNRAIVPTRRCKNFYCQPRPRRRQCRAAVRFHLRHHRRIIRRIYHHRHARMIFRRAPQHARPADVDIFNRIVQRDIRLGDRFLERIKIHHHQINRLDIVLGRRRFVFGIPANEQQAAVNFRMQRLHPAIHHFWETGELADFHHRHARLFDRACRPACGNNFDAELVKFAHELDQPRLIGNTDERSPDLTHTVAQPTGRRAEIQWNFNCDASGTSFY